MRLRSIQTDAEIGVGQVVEFLPARKGSYIMWAKVVDLSQERSEVYLSTPIAGTAWHPASTIGAYFGNHPKTLAKRKHGQTKKQAQDAANKAADARENSLAGGRCSSTGLTGDARRAVASVAPNFHEQGMAAAQFDLSKISQLGFTDIKLKMMLCSAGFNLTDIDGPEFDAIVAGLRLLAREVEAGNVVYPHDEVDIGDIWTNAGEHEGLPAEDIHKLADRLMGN